MILETKQVLFRAHVHSLDRRSRDAHDHFEQTIPSSCLVSMGTTLKCGQRCQHPRSSLNLVELHYVSDDFYDHKKVGSNKR